MSIGNKNSLLILILALLCPKGLSAGPICTIPAALYVSEKSSESFLELSQCMEITVMRRWQSIDCFDFAQLYVEEPTVVMFTVLKACILMDDDEIEQRPNGSRELDRLNNDRVTLFRSQWQRDGYLLSAPAVVETDPDAAYQVITNSDGAACISSGDDVACLPRE